MTKKWNRMNLFLGIPAAALVLCMTLVGCDDGGGDDDEEYIQKVDGTVSTKYQKAPQVGTVTVKKTGDRRYYIVSWDAVGDYTNSYTLYLRQEGKKNTVPNFDRYTDAQSKYTYDPSTGEEIGNTNLDKWSAQISSLSVVAAPGTYQVGVRTSSSKGGFEPSDIQWSSTDNIVLLPGLKLTTAPVLSLSGSTLTFTGNVVSGASSYTARVYRNGEAVTNSPPTINGATFTGNFPIYYFSSGDICTVSVSPVSSDISVLPGEPVLSNEITIP